MTTAVPMRVHIQGSGKVGRALSKRLRFVGWPVTLRAARKGPPRVLEADVVFFAVRDGEIARDARCWREAGVVPAKAVVLHLAGALGAEALAALRPVCRGVGQMHPLLSFASSRACPDLGGGFALITGDPPAVRAAKRVAGALGMRPRVGHGVDLGAYHAAAWLVAGGTAALSQAARDILVRGGFEAREAERMIAPLIRSVGTNVARLGLPEALTGVVRRGDIATLRRHVQVLACSAPEHLGLYLSCAGAQVAMARALSDAPKAALDALQNEIDALQASASSPRTLRTGGK